MHLHISAQTTIKTCCPRAGAKLSPSHSHPGLVSPLGACRGSEVNMLIEGTDCCKWLLGLCTAENSTRAEGTGLAQLCLESRLSDSKTALQHFSWRIRQNPYIRMNGLSYFFSMTWESHIFLCRVWICACLLVSFIKFQTFLYKYIISAQHEVSTNINKLY